MKTRDPFLAAFGIWLDRLIVWLVLVLTSFTLLWSLMWERAFNQPWSEVVRQLQDVATGHAPPVVNVLAALTFAVAALVTSLLAAWLFAHWRRQGQLKASHVRGSKLED